MMEARRAVDMAQNCEDILMNFVVAEEGNAGPMLVGAEKVRVSLLSPLRFGNHTN